MFRKNKGNKFIKRLKDAYSHIKLKKFDRAIVAYNKINSLYKSLEENDKTPKLKKDILTLYKELSLYLSVNEAYIMAQQGNFTALDNEIKKIHDLTYDLENNQNESQLLEYGKQHHKFFLEVYTFHTNTNQFDKKYQNIKNLIEENHEEAMKEFSQLIVLYNKLAAYLDISRKEAMYSKLKEVYRDLSIKKLFMMSRQKFRGIESVKEQKPKIRKLEKNPTEKRELGTSFKELHERIKEGDYSKIIEMYENL